jgi:hypothetical protein
MLSTLGPAPAIDRLVVVAHAADVLTALGQQAQPQVLGDVGVLVLVDHHVFEAGLEVGQDVGMAGEDRDVVQQQIAEIAGIEDAQAVLILAIQGHALARRELGPFSGRHPVRRPALVLPVVDHPRQDLRGPALGVDIGRLDQLLQQPFLVVIVDDGEAGLQPDQLGMAAQDLGGDRVEGAEPAQAFGFRADDVGDPLAHLAGGLVGEGHRQHFPGPRATGRQDVGEAGRQHTGLARSGTRKDQDRAFGGFDRRALFGVQPVQIAGGNRGRTARPGQVGNAGRGEITIKRRRVEG